RSYVRRSKRIQFVKGEQDESGEWKSFHYVVHSSKYGRYNITLEDGVYHCNCPFFKHRRICSHIFGVCQIVGQWPSRESVLGEI
ncbi:MAG: hypothetical protein RTU30_10795, partial [Candidatus Thorarchaeota archaeon]